LLVGDQNIGELRWELLQSDEQRVELQARGETYKTLSALTAFRAEAAGIGAQPTQGAIAVPLTCANKGTIEAFTIDSGRKLRFERVSGPT
jgi:hypothetical protein